MDQIKPKKLRIPEFRLVQDLANRSTVIGNAAAFMHKLPADKIWLLVIKEEKERRRTLQSDLMWVFHGIWGKHKGLTPKEAHSEIKRDILLPMKLSLSLIHI